MLVPSTGFEPARYTARDFKSLLATSYNTRAFLVFYSLVFLLHFTNTNVFMISTFWTYKLGTLIPIHLEFFSFVFCLEVYLEFQVYFYAYNFKISGDRDFNMSNPYMCEMIFNHLLLVAPQYCLHGLFCTSIHLCRNECEICQCSTYITC